MPTTTCVISQFKKTLPRPYAANRTVISPHGERHPVTGASQKRIGLMPSVLLPAVTTQSRSFSGSPTIVQTTRLTRSTTPGTRFKKL